MRASTCSSITRTRRTRSTQCCMPHANRLRGSLIAVFGCGGDRDRGKRPEMGRIASALADRTIVTSDNPRHEDPRAIVDEILCGRGARRRGDGRTRSARGDPRGRARRTPGRRRRRCGQRARNRIRSSAPRRSTSTIATKSARRSPCAGRRRHEDRARTRRSSRERARARRRAARGIRRAFRRIRARSQPGDAFVALRGERFDGHAYVARALAAGARLVVVDDAGAVPAGVPALLVDDTTRAYLAFGACARAMSSARVVAITGSAGKTTTKAFLAQVLERAQPGRVIATPANENNEIGVAKLLLAVPADAAYVVVEFGARRYGEIEPLARAAAPDVAILTNVGDAHLEIFGSQERLAHTKWGIFATGARRIINAADSISMERAMRGRRRRTHDGIRARRARTTCAAWRRPSSWKAARV